MIWNKKKNKKDEVMIGINEIKKKLSELLHRQKAEPFDKIETIINENTEQLSRISRLLYKSNQEAAKNSTLLLDQIGSLSQACTIGNESIKITILENKHNVLVSGIMHSIDNIDVLLNGQQEIPNEWNSFLTVMRNKQLADLNKAGVSEIQLMGTVFNPFFAEAVDSIPISELGAREPSFSPYEIIGVYRRGFSGDDGRVLRKAQVVTVEGNSNNL